VSIPFDTYDFMCLQSPRWESVADFMSDRNSTFQGRAIETDSTITLFGTCGLNPRETAIVNEPHWRKRLPSQTEVVLRKQWLRDQLHDYANGAGVEWSRMTDSEAAWFRQEWNEIKKAREKAKIYAKKQATEKRKSEYPA